MVVDRELGEAYHAMVRARRGPPVGNTPPCALGPCACVFAECAWPACMRVCVVPCRVCAGVDRCFVGRCQCLLTVALSASIHAPACVGVPCLVSRPGAWLVALPYYYYSTLSPHCSHEHREGGGVGLGGWVHGYR